MERESFILYTEQKEVIDKLNDEQAGKLIKAIYEYEKTGNMPKLDSMLDIVITPFKLALDKNDNKWQEIKQKRKQAGKASAEKKKQQNSTNSTSVKFVEQTSTNSTVNVNDNVNVNVNDNDNVNVNNNINTAAAVVSESCVDGLQEIINFYNNNIGMITPYGLEILTSFAKEMDKDLIIFAMQKAVEADIRTIQYVKGILNAWSKKKITTVIEAKKEDEEFKNKKTKNIEKKTQYNNYEQRQYDNLDNLYTNLNGGNST